MKPPRLPDPARDGRNEDLPRTLPGRTRGQTVPTRRDLRPPRSQPAGGGNTAAGDGNVGHFALGDEIGRGGMGVVHAATDTRLQRELAVKWLQRADDPIARQRFLAEAQITGQLQHPNIVPVHELGEDANGRPFIAMKLVSGRTLTQVIRDEFGPAVPDDAARRRLIAIWLRVCDAVAYAHSRGFMHRDLKPDNVMVGEFGEVLVMDWGLARPLAGRDDDDPPATTTTAPHGSSPRASGTAVTLQGMVVGTPAYMPPEQATGSINQLDEGADIHALGGILYTVLTNELPVTAREATAQLQEVIEHRLVAPSRRVPRAHVPRELDAIVMRAMARRRRDRYETVAAMQADVERWLAGQLVSAARYTPWQRLAKWASRHRGFVQGAAATGVALLLGLIGMLISEQSRLQAAAQAEAAQRQTAEEAQQRREAELLALAQRGEIDALVSRLGGQLQRNRDAALDEFDRLYKQARATGRSDDDFLTGLGDERTARTIKALEALVAAHAEFGEQVPIRSDDWFYLALLHERGGDLARSRECLDAAIALDPANTRARNVRANQLIDAGHDSDAMADFDAALAANPDSVITLLNRGNLHFRRGRHAEAMADWARAAAIEPGLIEIYTNRGTALRMRSQYTAALDEFRTALTIDARSLAAHVGMSITLRAMHRYEEALEHAEQAVRWHPDRGKAWGERGCVRSDLKQYAAAIADFNEAIRLDPRDDTALYNRGVARLDTGDRAGALDDFRASLAIDANSERAWINL
ncbi:MAG: tetratricopeptide repeat protein, partial [Planctomycetota bacterium]